MRPSNYIEHVQRKCDTLVQSGLWTRRKIRPRAWLNNFKHDENDHLAAAIILDQVLFFSRAAAESLQRTAFDYLLSEFRRRGGSHNHPGAIVWTHVQDERPNPTDSGFTYARNLRIHCGVDEESIVPPEKILDAAAAGLPIVLVDDFLGSGEQLLKSWSRNFGDGRSLASIFAESPFPAYYMCLAASEYGKDRVQDNGCPVKLVPAHTLENSYHILCRDFSPSVPCRSEVTHRIDTFLRKWGPDLTLPDYMSHPDVRSYGFHGLGLTYAVEDGTPDATLPVIWAPGPTRTWTTLVERR